METYLLYRAAELTDLEGYDYFRVIQRETDENRRVVATGYGAYDPFYSNFYCDYRFYGRRGLLRGYPRSWYAFAAPEFADSTARSAITTRSGAFCLGLSRRLCAMKRHRKLRWAKVKNPMIHHILTLMRFS